MADAGGPTLFAKSDSIYIMRRVNGQLTRIPFKYKKALKDPKFDVELQPSVKLLFHDASFDLGWVLREGQS